MEGEQANLLNKATPPPPPPIPVRQNTDRLGSLRCNENIKKGVDLASKTITLHPHQTFWYISLPSLYADYHEKLPNFMFEGGRKKTTTNFPFSFYIELGIGQ